MDSHIWNPCVGRTINQRVTMARQAMQAAVVKWTVLEVGRGQNRRNRLGSILEVPCIPSHDVWCSIVFSSVYIFLHGKEYTHIYTRIYTVYKGRPFMYAFCFDAFIFPHKTRLTKHRYIITADDPLTKDGDECGRWMMTVWMQGIACR